MDTAFIEQQFTDTQNYILEGKLIDAKNALSEITDIISDSEVPRFYKYFYFRFSFEIKLKLNDSTAFDDGLKTLEYADANEQKTATYYHLAYYSLQANNIPNAENFAISCIQHANSDAEKMDAYKISGRVKYKQGKLDDAIEDYNVAAAYAEKLHNERSLCFLILEISDVFDKKGYTEIAISEVSRAEVYARSCNNLDLCIRCAVKKAKLLYKVGRAADVEKVINAIPEQDD